MTGAIITGYLIILVASIVTTYRMHDRVRKLRRENDRLSKEQAAVTLAYGEVRNLQWGTQLACATLINRFQPVCDDCGDTTLDDESTVIGRDQSGIYVCCSECAYKNHLVGQRENMQAVDGDTHDLGVRLEVWPDES